jgi:hypothetical protein
MTVHLAIIAPGETPAALKHTYTTHKEAPDINKLHYWFGHIREKKICTLVNWLGIKLIGQCLMQCDICICKKQRRPLVCSGLALCAKKPMEILHLDLGGPILPPTRDGCWFYLAIIDSFSCWAHLYNVSLH